MNITSYIIIYYGIIFFIIALYINTGQKRILDIMMILSTSTIFFGVISFIFTSYEKEVANVKEMKSNYVNFVSTTFIKINQLFLDDPTYLNDLFYEFYGYSNFPHSQIHNIDAELQQKKELVAINIIIDYIYNMFVTNNDLFVKNTFRNKLLNITQSKKFKNVLRLMKNNYPNNFIKTLEQYGYINHEDMITKKVVIPYIKPPVSQSGF